MTATATTRMLRVFEVQFRHTYYNAESDRCLDLAVVPTPPCAAWMRAHGMLFRDRGNGFSLDVPATRLPSILAGSSADTSDGLNFLLLLRNPEFVGITAWPLSTAPTRQNLYASNLATSKQSSMLCLDSNALYPTCGAALQAVGRRAGMLTVTNALGSIQSTTALQPNQPATVNLGNSPYGLYNLQAKPKSAYTGPPSVLYTAGQPQPIGLMALWLRQPEGIGDPAAFPLQGQRLKPVALGLNFMARQTRWQYYVVSQAGQGTQLDELSITGEGAQFKRSDTRLPTGEMATLFMADTPLPLRQRSPYRFSLSGQRLGPDRAHGQIRLSPLPTASATPVWPSGDGNALSGTSEIFVYV